MDHTIELNMLTGTLIPAQTYYKAQRLRELWTLFGDERIDVVSESEWITEGTQVRVISAEGYRHIVRAVSADEAENV